MRVYKIPPKHVPTSSVWTIKTKFHILFVVVWLISSIFWISLFFLLVLWKWGFGTLSHKVKGIHTIVSAKLHVLERGMRRIADVASGSSEDWVKVQKDWMKVQRTGWRFWRTGWRLRGLGEGNSWSQVHLHRWVTRQRHVRLLVACRVHRRVWQRDVQCRQSAFSCSTSTSSVFRADENTLVNTWPHRRHLLLLKHRLFTCELCDLCVYRTISSQLASASFFLHSHKIPEPETHTCLTFSCTRPTHITADYVNVT